MVLCFFSWLFFILAVLLKSEMQYLIVFATLWFYVAAGGLSVIASVISNDLSWLVGLYYIGLEQFLVSPAHAG